MRPIRALISLALLSVALLTTSCRTMEGVGEDIERGGEKLQDAAD